MDTLTIITLVILAAALILGAGKGFVNQLGSFAAIVCGIIVCHLFAAQATAITAHLLGVRPEYSSLSHYSCTLIGCTVLFLIVWLTVRMVARMIHKALSAIKLGPVNSAAGALFMAFKWMLVLSIVLNGWLLVSPTSEAVARPSEIVEAVEKLAPNVLGFIKDSTKEHINDFNGEN